jgi:RNA polymerase sigma-70 factor (ECF subfamily)
MPGELDGLVERAQRGDREAFDELVRQTYAGTWTLAVRLTANEEDARDVVQEAYLRAWRSIGRFRGDAQLTTWLYRITANCASTQMGKGAKHRHDELDDDVVLVDLSPQADPAGRAEQSAVRSHLVDAIDALPDGLRAVVVLRDVYDLPHEAIAAELGISETAAKVRLHRARRRLREVLDPLRNDEEDAHAV